ncbi:nectin 1a isoform X3 [Denticeps clupeoides]|uniref:Ig-like domain-containing protein n=1 Tax=Denticeps clupeoides TaxID=299321 RepID=A0AAY4CPT5_9TELE|nr:nectin-1-like isoform X3 [Denticeps clupeoides]
MHYNMWMNLLVAFMISGGQSQVVDMDTTRCGYAGSQVDLSCRFINSNPPVKVSQVTWQKLINGTKQNVAIANPALGVSVLPPFRERVKFKNPAVRRPMPSLEDTTITFSALQLSDEAEYICEYTTFPAGNRENTVNLTVNARPMIQMSLSTPTIVAGSSSSKMTVATCLSANGKPPGVITWDTMLDGETDTQETRNPDGTITVRSDYLVVPSQKIHKQKLTCITTYHNERFTDSVTLNIQYEPEVTIEGFDGNWYLNRENVQLKCQVDANPPVSLYQWRFLNGSIPNKVEIRENILLFKEPVSYQLTGTYVCDATNSIGTRSASVDVVVTENPLAQSSTEGVMSILSWVVALGLIFGLAVAVFLVNRQHQSGHSETDSNPNSPSPTHKLALSKKKGTDDFQNPGKYYDELPNTADYVSYRLACNKDDYLEQHSPPIHPPLTYLPQNPYSQHSSRSPVFQYPTPGSIPPFMFPKEQYV